jgi:aminopeptidase N
MVDPPFRTGSGGMEYPTLFTAGTGVLRDKKVHSPEGVIIHEFGHGYWYGFVANNEFEEAWLDEGVNTYSTGRVQGKAYGPGMLSASLFGWPLTRLINFPRYFDYELDRAAAIMIAERDPVTTPSWLFSSRMSYAMNVYQRAAACLSTLERYLGEATMLRVMRTFQMRFRFQHPSTQDFINVVNELSGQDLTWFFEQLFFSTYNLDYGVSRLRSEEKKDLYPGVFDVDGRKEEVKQKDIDKEKKQDQDKKGDQRTYVTDVTVRRFGEALLGGEARVKLRVAFEDGSEEVRYWDGQDRWESFRFEKTAKAKFAEVDPDLIWLVDSNISNNSLKVKAGRSGVIRLTSRLLFWVQNYLHYLSALS